MTNKARKPDYVGNGVAVWKNKALATGKEYLTISLFGGEIKIPAFKQEEKVEAKTTEENI